ncbi:DUF2726 domain-containing protein [Cognatishimia activa]|uniref:DUF2726 domain-containing protein n=1 Tax=Cognatishimia activa TaxID=1715691 RepID=UPI00222F9037|nr:DUF2726 domain-containing protein [Cognatishimia activa]UZD91618.1 DUF2726 domain-containing protein [Cognatishimia activa]
MELFLVFLVVFLGVLFWREGRKPRRRKHTNVRPINSARRHWGDRNNKGMADPANQLNAISKVNFEKVQILNKSEYRVFVELEKVVDSYAGKYRLMAQTSLGELLKPRMSSGDWKERKEAFASINSKRLDFAVIDENGLLALAIEYQGAGHYQEKAFMRDAVKREVLRRAGVPFLEVKKGTKPSELRSDVEKLLSNKAPWGVPSRR